MELASGNVIDYFAALGLESNEKGTEFICKNIPNLGFEGTSNRWSTPKEIWNNAITDIGIFNKVDDAKQLNDGWEVISTSVEGDHLKAPYLAFKRRKTTNSFNHISNILVNEEDSTLGEYKFIEPVKINDIKPFVTGQSHAHLFCHLIFKKSAKDFSLSILRGSPIIDDLVIVNYDADEEVWS